MGYKKVDAMDIYEIIRRWHAGQNISHIAVLQRADRKTIRKYLSLAVENGIGKDKPLPPKDEVLKRIVPFLEHEHQKPAPVQSLLKPYLEEIIALVTDPHYRLKPKIAFEVICERHDLEDKISYSSFKRFARAHDSISTSKKSTCRIEVPPAHELQIDYGYMGLLKDPLAGRRRKIYAFIATLSYSRHQYVEFVYTQDQQSFVASHVRMFNYFGGTTLRLVIDNLKAGVLKPDLYEPTLNHAYREMAEYYHCFIDPCRVGRPQDKGKVENQVPVVRQQFRKQLALFSHMDIGSANQLVRQWCLEKHGHRIHGTTQWKPYPTFLQEEKPLLQPLPEEPFEVPLWKQATVHPDHYIQFDKKTYSVPDQYCGQDVWVRGTEKLVQIFFRYQLIKQHIKTARYRHTDFTDFPKNMQAVLDQGVPKALQRRAGVISAHFGRLIRKILEPHAYINMRKARGLLSLADRFEPELIDQAAQRALNESLPVTPRTFKLLLESLQSDARDKEHIALSEQTLAFTRSMSYFVRQSSLTERSRQ